MNPLETMAYQFVTGLKYNSLNELSEMGFMKEEVYSVHENDEEERLFFFFHDFSCLVISDAGLELIEPRSLQNIIVNAYPFKDQTIIKITDHVYKGRH